jgi:CBS domain-containing protein
MLTIKHLLERKGFDVWRVPPEMLVYDALKLMADKDVGALLVMDGEKLVGIFSERNYARKVILKGRSSREIPVKDIMTYNVVCATPEMTIDRGLELMSEARVHHLPVLEGDRLIGVVSIGDLVKAIISEQKRWISRLERYILENTSIT